MSTFENIWNADPGLFWGYVAGKLSGRSGLIRPLLIAVRGIKPGDKVGHELRHVPVYDDTFVILDPAGATPEVYAAATHAYQNNSKLSPDENGDGVGDVGSIRPGTYILKDLKAGKYPIFHLLMPNGSDKIPSIRDFNHDGKLDISEISKSESMKSGNQVNSTGTYSNSVLWHCGVDAPADSSHRSSISCFTSSQKYLDRASKLASKYGGTIDLILITYLTLDEVAVEYFKEFHDEPDSIA